MNDYDNEDPSVWVTQLELVVGPQRGPYISSGEHIKTKSLEIETMLTCCWALDGHRVPI